VTKTARHPVNYCTGSEENARVGRKFNDIGNDCYYRPRRRLGMRLRLFG